MAKRVKKKRSQVRATKRTAKPASEVPKKKRRLSKSPEAVRARAYRAQQKAAAAKAAAAKQKRARKAARTRKRNAAERESIELGERERRADELAASTRRRTGDERQLLTDVLDDMRNVAASVLPMSLSITEAEVGSRVPWLVVGRFDPTEDCFYEDLNRVFRAWETDLVLEARIHPQRLSMIRIVYSDPNAKRGESDSIVSSIGPWETVISEIAHELDPSDEDSLATRYKETTVPSFYVYFSGQLASEVEISL